MSEKEIFKRMPGLVEAGEGEEIPFSDPVFGMSFEYDRKAGAIYVRLSKDEKVKRTEFVTENCYFDLDEHGSVIGIEILDAKEWIEKYLNEIING